MSREPGHGAAAMHARSAAKALVRRYGTATAALRPGPDFLIVGTKRGGTTSLWNWLLQHPQVMPMLPERQHIKSPHYFYWHYDNGPSWYRGFFPSRPARFLRARRIGGRVVTGEGSPYYLFDPRVASRVAAMLPDVRIIVLLRNPVDRAASQHRERVRAGVEPLSLRDALAAEPDRLAGELEHMEADPSYYSTAHDWFSYRSRGIYAPQLERWSMFVPPERLLVLQSERLYDHPIDTFARVTDFLGIARFRDIDGKRWNYHAHEEMDPGVRAELREFYVPHNEQLFRLLGQRYDWDGAVVTE